jgi:hypothetical protein
VSEILVIKLCSQFAEAIRSSNLFYHRRMLLERPKTYLMGERAWPESFWLWRFDCRLCKRREILGTAAGAEVEGGDTG